MKFIINNFAGGIADDRYDDTPGAYAFSKQFDTLTHPRRLVPLRGMTSDTANTGIGNIIVASNGLMYGSGEDGNNPGNGKLWKRSGYGGSDVWGALATNQLSGAALNYDFLVDWPDAGNIRTLHWASNNLLVASDPAGGSSASTSALSYVTIGQGLVHPKDKILYFPYKTSSTHYIGAITANATPFSGLASTAFALQFQYRAYCLSYYGNYLAIPLTSTQGIGVNGSYVGLWNRDTSITTFDEIIPWGAGNLQVLNNLGGVLIGISTKSANNTESFQDYDSILIKAWDGGAEPTLIKELKVPYSYAASPTVSHPQATINPRVNFIYQNRLYFSVNLVPGDSIHPARYGLWSVGRNKLTGEWTVIQERVATNTNSETGVIAAAITGDFVSMAHTAAGTLTYTINGVQSSSTFAATSVYESLVNPEMRTQDKYELKKLQNIRVNFLPLPTSAQIVLKYRVDSAGDDNDWIIIATYTTANGVSFKTGKAASSQFKDGYSYQFRIESTGGATITGYEYEYQTLI